MSVLDDEFPELVTAWNALRKIWFQESKQWTFGRLKSEHILEGQNPVEDRALEAGKDYLTVSLRSLWIANTRSGWTTFYPAMHAFAKVPVFIGPPSEFHVLTSPTKLKAVTEAGLDKVISGRQRLVGPLAYWGSDVSLELALFSIKAQDLAAPFLGILGELSAVAGGTFLTSALAVADPLKKGIALLTGTDSNSLEVGYFADLDLPRTGYYAAIREQGVDLDNTWLRQGHLIDGAGVSIRKAPYFVFSIEASATRSDWGQLPGLVAPWVAFRQAAAERDPKALKAAYEKVRILIAASDDLLPPQRTVILGMLQQNHDAVVAELKRPSITPTAMAVPSLDEIAGPSSFEADVLAEVDPIDVSPPHPIR